MSILASEVPIEFMGRAMGVFGASFGLGMSLGPVVGPAVASASNVKVPFIMASVLGGIAALSSLFLREERRALLKRTRRREKVRDLRLYSLSLVAFTLLYGMGSIVVIYPRYIMSKLGLSLDTVAISMALASLTYTFLQPVTGRLADLVDKRLLIYVGLALSAAAVSLLGMVNRPSHIYALMFVFGVSGSLVFPSSTALVSIIAPKGREGAYTGIYNAMLSFGVTISPIVVGALSDALGYAVGFASIAPLALASLALLHFSLQKY
jgi:MFS family permease